MNPVEARIRHPGLNQLLAHMVKMRASDLYITVGSPPVFRVDGVGHSARVALDVNSVTEMVESLIDASERQAFHRSHELNLSGVVEDGSRFRFNLFQQRGCPGMVIRRIPTDIPTVTSLGLPAILESVALSRSGLVLVVGAAGSGKSTTLAALINARNEHSTGHIITVEDPIEFIHPHKKCVVTQREVGIDTPTVQSALKNALRQAPDVILVGEVRDAETMAAALEFAETGHLCLATLHSTHASQAVERVVSFFEARRRDEICLQLSTTLRAIVAQRLVPAVPHGRTVALEVLLNTPRICALIRRGDFDVLTDAMQQSQSEGCQTFDSALLSLVQGNRIQHDEALRHADRPNDLRLQLQRATVDRTQQGGSATVLRLVPESRPRK